MVKFTRASVQKLDFDKNHAVTLETIPINKLRPNPYQPRKYFSDEAIAELAASIKEIGLLQPINVRKVGQDQYELIAGERRMRACRMAGFTHIKALVQTNAIDQDSATLAMIENLQRENLHFFEEAEGYQALIREHGFTQEELARRLSKNQSTIANKLRILRLAPTVKEKLLEHGLTERHARALLRLHNEAAQLRLIDFIAEEGLSVKSTEELVEKELDRIYGEVKDEPQNIIKMRCNYNIYINTIKKTVKKINQMGGAVTYDVAEKEDCIEVMLRVKK